MMKNDIFHEKMIPKKPFIHILMREIFSKAFWFKKRCWEGKKWSVHVVLRGQKLMRLVKSHGFNLGR